jgi:hypothetical protein
LEISRVPRISLPRELRVYLRALPRLKGCLRVREGRRVEVDREEVEEPPRGAED